MPLVPNRTLWRGEPSPTRSGFALSVTPIVSPCTILSYYIPIATPAFNPIRMESPQGRALQQLSRSDLLGAGTLGSILPFCPPTGSRRHELELVVGTCFCDLMG